jgi:hypothetical protein
MSLGRWLNSTGDLGSKGIIYLKKKIYASSHKESEATVW